ncbi:MAG: hypothetical protein ABIU54_01610 [Candidatus Eisenbacteria bacterium]
MTFRNLSIVLMLAGLALEGCAKSGGMNAEMRQQEVEMNSDVAGWSGDVSGWTADNDRMLGELQAKHPAPGSDLEKEVADCESKRAEHARNVAEFGVALGTHSDELKAESARPEHDRVMAHTALWGKHVAIKASQASLASAHKSLLETHSELLTKLAAVH